MSSSRGKSLKHGKDISPCPHMFGRPFDNETKNVNQSYQKISSIFFHKNTFSIRGHSITTWTRGVGRWSKIGHILSTSRVKILLKKVDGWSKIGKIVSTWLLNDPYIT